MKQFADTVRAQGAANTQAFQTLADAALRAAERLAVLNLNIAREACQEAVARSEAIFAARDPQELLTIQLSWLQPSIDKAVTWGATAQGIAADAREDLGKIFEERATAVRSEFTAGLDQVAKNAPAGADVAVSAVKNAMAAAAAASDSISRSARQVVEAAEANVAAATGAAVKAAKTVSKPVSAKK